MAEAVAALVGRFTRPGGPRNEDWAALSDALKDAVARRDQAFLFAFHEAALGHAQLRSWPAQSSFRAAGLIPEAGALRRFLERARTPPVTERPAHSRLVDRPARALGGLLAYAQPDELLERELEWFGAEPSLQALFACWVQERVVRGSDVGRSPFVERFWASLAHPLAALPLHRLAVEENVVGTAPHTGDTLGNWYTFPLARLDAQEHPEGDWRADWAPLGADPRALCAVLADPALAPNATLEAKVVQFAQRPPKLEALALRSLELECVAEGKTESARRAAREVMAALVCLGTTGGAYGEVRSAAWGRLLAWRSLRALVGLDDDATYADVEARAERCEWLQFQNDGRWFNHVTFDLGLACLRPDASLAVVAMTDTD